MKKITLKFFLCIFIFIFAFYFAQPVFAHGGEPRLEISAERLNPGSALEIRGVDFEFEEEITLALIGSQIVVPLSTVIGDAEGIFLLTITLPLDLAEGIYIIRATTDDHIVDSPQITVWGIAAQEGGGHGPRDDDDSLLAPMPTSAAGVVPDDAISQAQTQPTTQATSASDSKPIVLVVVVLMVIGVSVAFGLKRRHMQ